MTCVAFQAVREYIVGKTAPVPVKIYDYYEPGVYLMNPISRAEAHAHTRLKKKKKKEIYFFQFENDGEYHCLCICVTVLLSICTPNAAFEATRFYNVSESSPLARELCDGPTCNEVESSTNQWIGGTYTPDPLTVSRRPTFVILLQKRFSLLQVSCRQISATTCLAVWRRSSLSVAHVTGTVGMTGSLFVGQMGRSTRTSVKWRSLPVETGRVSSRFLCPSAHTVRAGS